MKKIFALALFTWPYSSHLLSQTPDWSSKVASIIYNNCSTCHHDGGIAPFPLMSYDDAVSNAFSIQQDVNASKMPPWPPDPSFNHFRDEKVLSGDELTAINEWVDGGMPAGDLTLAPAPPLFNGNSMMQMIDDTIQLPPYTVQLENDEYRTFVIHSGYSASKFINQVEFIPGNASIVHHVFLFQDSSNVSYQKDLDDPGPGFAGGGLGGFSPDAVLICGWIPGSDIVSLPSNMGFEVPAGADFAISVHYAPGSIGKTDSMKINLRFSNVSDVRPVRDYRLLYYHTPSLINPPFQIPANQVKTFYEKSAVASKDKSMIALQPHMHLIGKSFKVYMVTTPGDTTNLLYIPDWSFHWQMDYFLTKVMKVPVGAQIFGEGVYDNTINNPDNPSNPPVNVHGGESTFNEMMGCHFSMLDYQPGDENIILDSTFFTTGEDELMINNLFIEVFPNPANHVIRFVTDLQEHEVNWMLTDVSGREIKTMYKKNIPKGVYTGEVDASDITSGVYFLSVTSGNGRGVRKVIVVK